MKGSGTSCRLTLWVALAAVPPACALAALTMSPRRATSSGSGPDSSPPPHSKFRGRAGRSFPARARP